MNKQDEFEAAYRELIMVSNHPDLRERYQWLHERIGELADHLRALRGVPLTTVREMLDSAWCNGFSHRCVVAMMHPSNQQRKIDVDAILGEHGYGDDDD